MYKEKGRMGRGEWLKFQIGIKENGWRSLCKIWKNQEEFQSLWRAGQPGRNRSLQGYWLTRHHSLGNILVVLTLGQSRPDCFLLGDAGLSSQFLSFSWFPSKANRNVIMKICISHFISFHIIPVFPPEPTVSRKHTNALSKFTIIRKIFPNQKSYL